MVTNVQVYAALHCHELFGQLCKFFFSQTGQPFCTKSYKATDINPVLIDRIETEIVKMKCITTRDFFPYNNQNPVLNQCDNCIRNGSSSLK